jgi:hypothetical protein
VLGKNAIAIVKQEFVAQLPARSVPTDQGLRTNDNQGIPQVASATDSAATFGDLATELDRWCADCGERAT